MASSETLPRDLPIDGLSHSVKVVLAV